MTEKEIGMLKTEIKGELKNNCILILNITKLRKRVTLSIEPFSSKSRLKNCAVSMLTPIAANTMAKLSSSPPSCVKRDL